jgi:CHAT domain-containing protein/tetratricopeptide (TPR) repeat protein
MTRARAALVGVAIAAASGAAAAATFGGDAPRDARAIYRESLDATLRGEADSALLLLAAAWRADPEWLVPIVDLNAHADDNAGVPLSVRRSLDSIALAYGDSVLMRCIHRLMVGEYDASAARSTLQHPHELTRRCAALTLDIAANHQRPTPLGQRYAESVITQRDFVDRLVESNPQAAWDLVRRGRPAHPLTEVYWMSAGARALHMLGRDQDAETFERQSEQRAMQLGPGAHRLMLVRQRGHAMNIGVAADEALEPHRRATDSAALTTLGQLMPGLSARTRFDELGARWVDLQSVGRLTESNAILTKALRLADSMQSVKGMAFSRARMGRNLVKLGRLHEAERELHLARALSMQAEAIGVLSEVSHDLLHLHEARGDYASAISAGEDFARFSRVSASPATIPMAQHDLGWLHRRHGNVAAAEAAFQRMLPDLDLETGHFWAGEYLEYAGQLEAARARYQLATKYAQDRGRAYAGLVRTNEALGEIDEATRVAELADRDSAAWHPEYAPLVPGILARHGDRRAARAQFRRARELLQRRGQTQSFAQVALESAENERALGDERAARVLADSAAAAASLVGARELEARARAVAALAGLRGAPGPQRAAAFASLEASVRRGDAMRIAQLSASLHLLHAEALALVGRQGDALRALTRAADWVDSTAARIAADPSRASYRAMHDGVTRRALALLLRDPGIPGRAVRFAEWSARRKGGRVTVGSQWRNMPSGRAIIDYVVLDSVVGALVATRAGVSIVALDVGPDSVRHWVARFRAPIAPRVGSSIDRAHLGFDDVMAARLYEALIDPLMPLLGGRTEIAILPDGVLHMLPFDALLSSRAPRRFLIDDYTIVYATPASRSPARQRADSAWSVLAVGGEPGAVVGAVEELRAIDSVIGRRLTILQGAGATAAGVRRAAETTRPSVVHLATHAEANDVSPDHARLALAPDSSSTEGWLRAFEIRDWQLHGALVVLSACETAVGRLAGGEGTLSISRAFLQAGAASTVATLWPIGAPTAELMAPFYRGLERGTSPAAALRAARLELRARGYEHPFYWAPFVITTSLSHLGARADNQ